MRDTIKYYGIGGMAMKAAPSHGVANHFFSSLGRLPRILPPIFLPGKILISTTGIAWNYSGSIPYYISKLNKH